jgi:hypothetical protein
MRIRNLLKKALLFVATGATSILLAACYGVPMVLARFSIRAHTADNEGIKGLRVEPAMGNEAVETDAEGRAGGEGYTFQFNHTIPLIIEDVDDEANGGPYAQRWVEAPVNGAELDVEMSLASEEAAVDGAP